MNQEEITSDICNALDCLGSLGLSKEKLSIEVKLPTDKRVVGFDVRKYRLPQQIKERYEDRLSQPPPTSKAERPTFGGHRGGSEYRERTNRRGQRKPWPEAQES